MGGFGDRKSGCHSQDRESQAPALGCAGLLRVAASSAFGRHALTPFPARKPRWNAIHSDRAAIAADAQGAYRASVFSTLAPTASRPDASDAKFDKVTPTSRTPLCRGKTERIKSRLAW